MPDTITANQAKPISAPRWLIGMSVSSLSQRFSSEDLPVTATDVKFGTAYFGTAHFGS